MNNETISSEIREPVERTERIGWYFYDWANSVFPTTVGTVFLGPYLTSVAQEAAKDSDGFLYILGIPILADAFFPYTVALSVFLQIFFLPILGAIADYTRIKKQLLGIFAYIGAFATMGLYFLQGGNYLLGGGLFIIANLSFGAAVVFYNAFLPELASPDERDALSSTGWAMGYLGGGVLLALNLLFVQFLREPLGVDLNHAVRICLASAGVWWAIFTILPLFTLKQRRMARTLPAGERYISVGFKQLIHTLRQLPNYPHTLLYLIAYLMYNDGIQTVIATSAQFGSQELGLDTGTLIQLVLMIQFIAFFGAIGFNYIAKAMGTKRAIILSLVLWSGVVLYTYAFLQTTTEFFILGAVIAIILGGSQALSRSLFSQMIPPGQESEYFSLYEISERGSSWLGPLLFGLSLQFTGSYRFAVLSVLIFFIIGLTLLTRVDVRRAIREAGNVLPKYV